jgi:prepilin-type processing-associated H-X9-DG protein
MLLMTDLGYDDPEHEHKTLVNTGNLPWVAQLTSQYVKYISYRHLERTNVLFADGHAASCGKGNYDTVNSGWVPKGTRWVKGGDIY